MSRRTENTLRFFAGMGMSACTVRLLASLLGSHDWGWWLLGPMAYLTSWNLMYCVLSDFEEHKGEEPS
jgi:hypothetical protein